MKAGEQVGAGRAKRVGLVSTNSIRGGANRRALKTAIEGRPIFEAWSDEPWVIDGAAVRVSLVCFARSEDGSAPERRLDDEVVDAVHADLTARRGGAGVDLTGVERLYRNFGVAFMGDTKGGPFDVPGDQAREWLREPANPNGQPNSDVLGPWMNGMEMMHCKHWEEFGQGLLIEDAEFLRHLKCIFGRIFIFGGAEHVLREITIRNSKTGEPRLVDCILLSDMCLEVIQRRVRLEVSCPFWFRLKSIWWKWLR